MKKIYLLLFAIMTLQACQTEMEKPTSISEYPVYEGTDLGLMYNEKKSTVKVYSPGIDSMRIHLYEKGHEGSPIETRQMEYGKNGIWSIDLDGDWKGKYYTVQAFYSGKWLNERLNHTQKLQVQTECVRCS